MTDATSATRSRVLVLEHLAQRDTALWLNATKDKLPLSDPMAVYNKWPSNNDKFDRRLLRYLDSNHYEETRLLCLINGTSDAPAATLRAFGSKPAPLI